jgi:predicted glycosyltransferase
MKVWYDACTGKHIRYGTAIARRLRKSGHEVIFTTRDHPDTVPLAKILGEKPIVVGKYSPQSLFSRLEESANRVIMFSKMFKGNLPDVAVSHQSVELCRTAFGLGVPIILTADTPHATAVNRLTIPFADVVVASSSIPASFLRHEGAKKVIQFKGVDEVAWIKGFKPTEIVGLSKPLIVARELETKAAYAATRTDFTENAAQELGSLGNVHFIGRYRDPGGEFRDRLGFLDSANLAAQADLVVTSGGTLAREAALQGVPSIVVSELGNTYVNRYLADLGFPLYIIKPQELLETAKQNIGKRVNVESKLASLENPLDKIETMLCNVA